MGRKIRYGEIYKSNNYGDFIPIEFIGGDKDLIKIEFVNTKSTAIVTSNALVHGSVKDKFMPNIANVGFIGGYEGKITEYPTILFYRVWNDMINRCYNKSDKDYKLYGGLGIKVDERWFNFNNFYNDCKLLINYDKKLKYPSLYNLDKDYLQMNIPKEKRIYSVNTCIWISKHDNIIITARENSNSKYYGVCEIDNKIFIARYSSYFIGKFNNEIAAANAYNYFYLIKNLKNEFNNIYILNKVPYMNPSEFKKYMINVNNNSPCLNNIINKVQRLSPYGT